MYLRRFTVLALALLLVPAACGDDEPSSAPAAPANEKLTGTPYKIVSIIDVSDIDAHEEMKVAGRAAVKAINEAGGVDGHPIEISFCSTGLDANQTTACAREAAADPDVIATVGNSMAYSDGAHEVLTKEGVAEIGVLQSALVDYKCAVCFPSSGGSVAAAVGQATLLVDVLDGERMNMVILDVPAAKQLAALIGIVLAGRDTTAKLDRVSYVPLDTTDFSAAAANVGGNDPDGIIIGLVRDGGLNFIQTAARQGVSSPLTGSTLTFSPNDFANLGVSAKNLYVVSAYKTTGPTVKLFEQQMDSINPKASKNDFAKAEWLAVRMFTDVAKTLPTVTRASVLEAMSKLSAYDTGLTPPLDFTKPFEGLGGAIPRMFDTKVTYAKVEDGKLVPALGGRFFDLFEPPAGN